MNRTLVIIGLASSLALAISGCSAPAQTGSTATQNEAQKPSRLRQLRSNRRMTPTFNMSKTMLE